MVDKKIIAMWSGPRNLSTALMYAFENRGDTKISDEPFYGYFLANNTINHPDRDLPKIINIIISKKASIIEINIDRNKLEDIFIKLTQNNNNNND